MKIVKDQLMIDAHQTEEFKMYQLILIDVNIVDALV